MPLYFAYGANMDRDAMAARCPGARAIGPARLARHRFVITSDGYASVMRDPRAEVHGVLWDLTLAHIRALDRFEEVDRGLYAKIQQPVIAASGPKKALVYVATGRPGGVPRPGYLEDVLAAARGWALPEPYLAAMARMLAVGRGAPSAPAARPQGGVPSVRPTATDPMAARPDASRASGTWRWGDD
jgi:gamma-glutamylcyclotransferase (GGCT)/AIG2-like uncharacterized protein YtfP